MLSQLARGVYLLLGQRVKVRRKGELWVLTDYVKDELLGSVPVVLLRDAKLRPRNGRVLVEGTFLEHEPAKGEVSMLRYRVGASIPNYKWTPAQVSQSLRVEYLRLGIDGSIEQWGNCRNV